MMVSVSGLSPLPAPVSVMPLLSVTVSLYVPAATWMVSAGLSFLDGYLIVGQGPLSIAGMVAAVLLGGLTNPRQVRAGLAIVVVCATTVVYNDPTHAIGRYERMLSSGPRRSNSQPPRAAAMNARCVWHTPFGRPVVPEV